MWCGIIIGVVLAIVMAFPVGGLMALLFRFPIPLGGYASGFSAVLPAMAAVVFYGIILGGFVLLGLLGGIAGAIVFRQTAWVNRLFWKTITIACLLIDILVLFILAIWDKIMGPW